MLASMANPALVEAIRAYRFEEWRQANMEGEIDLAGADLRELTLTMRSLEGADLRGAKLPSCVDMSFRKCDLRGATIGGDCVGGVAVDSTPMLHGCDFSDALLDGVCCEKVQAYECKFDRASIDGIRARASCWRGCTFRGVFVNSSWSKQIAKPDFNLASISYGGCADFSESEFSECDLAGAKLWGASFWRSRLRDTSLRQSVMAGGNLAGAEFHGCDCDESDLSCSHLGGVRATKTTFRKGSFRSCDMAGADFGAAHVRRLNNWRISPTGSAYESCQHEYHAIDCAGADFTGALLEGASLVRTNLNHALLVDVAVYGASVWSVSLEGARQRNIRVTAFDEPPMTVDSLPMAQFIHLLRSANSLRDVIDEVTSKAVLILGRFGQGGLERLRVMAGVVREQGMSPIIFDWDPPRSRDLLETVCVLGRLSSFVLVDLTDPSSVPAEFMAIAQEVRSAPIYPLIHSSQRPFSMFEGVVHGRPAVQALVTFESESDLVEAIRSQIFPQVAMVRSKLASKAVL